MRLTPSALQVQDQPLRIVCGTVWGGIEPVRLDVSTKGLNGSLYSTASGGERGGDIYYLSVCSKDFLTRAMVADVRGHGEQVSEISSWIYQSLHDKMNSVDCAGVLSDLNELVHSRGFSAITTAAVVSHNILNSTLYYSYAGHPPVLARRSGRQWVPLLLGSESEQANLPLGVFRSTRYEQGEARVQSGDDFLLYTDGLSEAMNPETSQEFGDAELPALLESQPDAEVSRVRDALVEGVITFSGGPALQDDCTLMVLQVR